MSGKIFLMLAAIIFIGGVIYYMAAPAPATPRGQGGAGEVIPVATEPSLVLHLKDAARVEPPFHLVDRPDAAGGRAIEVPPKAGKEPGAVALAFTIPQEGKYSIWLRAYWGTDGEGSCSNSVALAIDGHEPALVEDATYERWHWVPYWKGWGIPLAAGEHELLLTCREDGILLDQVFLTPWHEEELRNRIPQGIEE